MTEIGLSLTGLMSSELIDPNLDDLQLSRVKMGNLQNNLSWFLDFFNLNKLTHGTIDLYEF